jgi:hypothetical protein
MELMLSEEGAMRFSNAKYLLLLIVASTAFGPAAAATTNNEELIKNAMSAAPPAVGKNATIVNFDEKMQMVTLREGTNGFTCVPDNPATPTNDPACLDAGAMEWQTAYNNKTAPPEGVIGFGYMLQGESAPNNMDPFATEPAAGEKWMEDGPHVMIFNVGDMLANYPQTEHPDHSQPYVMWPNTPYAHLMMPVE